MPQSYIELLLEERYGDLHDVIPRLANEHGQEGAASTLSTEKVPITQSWVSKWLRVNGYQRKSVYVRREKAS